MKNIILTYLALFLAFSLSGQKYVQEFTKTDGNSIAISLSDLAFAIPSGTANGSVLVLSPSAKTIYVTDSLQGIVDSSSVMLVLLEELYKLNGRDAVRDVAISKQQVKEVIPSGASKTFIKLASPQKTILINDDYATVAAALSAASGGGDPADGNGIYSGSDTIPLSTLAYLPPGADFELDFAIGKWPGFPNNTFNNDEFGLALSSSGDGAQLRNKTSSAVVYPTSVILTAQNQLLTKSSGIELSGGQVIITSNSVNTFFNANGISLNNTDAFGIFFGNGTPEASLAAIKGSIYLRLDGGAGTSLYVKESGFGNTGWVGK